MNEKLVLSGVLKKLSSYEFTGECVWVSRLNSGHVQSGRHWIKLCNAGTPDIVVIVKRYYDCITVLFIECKRSGVKKLQYEQQQFFDRMKDKPGIMCVVINDPKQIHEAVMKAREL